MANAWRRWFSVYTVRGLVQYLLWQGCCLLQHCAKEISSSLPPQCFLLFESLIWSLTAGAPHPDSYVCKPYTWLIITHLSVCHTMVRADPMHLCLQALCHAIAHRERKLVSLSLVHWWRLVAGAHRFRAHRDKMQGNQPCWVHVHLSQHRLSCAVSRDFESFKLCLYQLSKCLLMVTNELILDALLQIELKNSASVLLEVLYKLSGYIPVDHASCSLKLV